MQASIDHASLYSQAWFCFNETHSNKLANSRAKTWEDFIYLADNFWGSNESRKDLDEATLNRPAWSQPATDGIEYRIEAWERSNQDDRLSEVMTDLLGEPTVADHLAQDLLMEAQAAVGLSRVVEPNARVIDWWSRRVYVTAFALNGRTGEIIENHRPELIPVIRELLAESTTPFLPPDAEEDAKPVDIPKLVLDALEVGRGDKDFKEAATGVRKNVPVKPKEPDIEELEGLPPAQFYRTNEIQTGSR